MNQPVEQRMNIMEIRMRQAESRQEAAEADRDVLRAKSEQLALSNRLLRQDAEFGATKIVEQSAEIERLKQDLWKCQEQRDTMMTVTDRDWTRTLLQRNDELDALRTENEQLKPALKTLVDLWDMLSQRDGPIAAADEWKQAWRAAREALGPQTARD